MNFRESVFLIGSGLLNFNFGVRSVEVSQWAVRTNTVAFRLATRLLDRRLCNPSNNFSKSDDFSIRHWFIERQKHNLFKQLGASVFVIVCFNRYQTRPIRCIKTMSPKRFRQFHERWKT